jgi:hypothetical protein
MKIIFNKKKYGKIFIPFLITLTFALAGVLILKKTQQIEKESIFSKELTIDSITDLRALGYPGQRKIIKDTKGNIFVGYRKDYQKNAEIFIAKISPDITGLHISDTEKPISMIGKNNDQRVPSLAIDVADTIHVVWYGSDTQDTKNNRQIKYTRKPKGNTNWESWRDIAYVSGYNNDEFWQEHPMLLSGKDNMLYVVWEGKDEENKKQQIKFSKSTNSGLLWTKWKNISPSKNTTQSRPTLVEDKDGKLFLFIYSSQKIESGLQQIQFTSSSDKGETWGPWQLISSPTFDARHVSATADKLGNIHVTWRTQKVTNGPTQIIYRTFSENRWSDEKIVSPSTNYQFFPNIGIDQFEGVYISWMENLGPAEFPQENPTSGFGLVSFLKKGVFQPPVKLSEQNNILYPNVSEKTTLENFVPIFYTEKISDEEFKLKLKFLDTPK